MEDTLLTLLGYYLKLYLIAIIVVIVVVAIAALFTGIGVTWQTWQIPLANYYYYCYCCCIFRNLSFFLSPLPSYTFFLLYHICASVYLLNASSLPRCFISLLVNKTLLPTTHHKIPLNFNLFFLSLSLSLSPSNNSLYELVSSFLKTFSTTTQNFYSPCCWWTNHSFRYNRQELAKSRVK